MRHFRTTALIATLAVSPVLAACGGGGGGEDPQKVIEETFKGGQDVKSGNLDVSFTLNAEGAKQLAGKPIKFSLKGPFESLGKGKVPKFDLEVEAGAAGQSFNAGAVSTGEKGFIKFQSQAYAVDDNTFGLFKTAVENAEKQQSGKNKQSLASLGIDPKKWLKDPKNEGTETVGGAETVHVSSGVDVSAMLTDFSGLLGKASAMGLGGLPTGQQVPKEIPADVRKKIEEALKDVRLEVWSGKDDKILRKLVISLKFEVPADARAGANGLTGGDLNLTIAINDLNKPQTVKEPADTKPLSDLLGGLGAGGLGGLLGGAGGGGAVPGAGGGSVPGASPPGGGSGNLDAYSNCIQSAQGSDALTKCADLLK